MRPHPVRPLGRRDGRLTVAGPGGALIRCMGGGFCRHTPGTCTATTPAPVRPQLGAVGAVPLTPAARDPEDERRAAAIAWGLYCLEAPLGSSLTRGWDRLEPARRDLFMARARLVLSHAADRLG